MGTRRSKALPTPEPLAPLSGQLARAVARIRARPGVVAVSWAAPRAGGEWGVEPCLVVHVRWKHEPSRARDRIPATIDGIRVDVLEVAPARTLSNGWFDHSDVAIPSMPPRGRRTCPSIVRTAHDATYALVSGHGTLRITNGAFRASPGDEVALLDPNLGQVTGTMLAGAVGRGYDFAYVRFERDDARWSAWHYAAGTPPVALRATALEYNEPLLHFSPLSHRRRHVWGFYRGDILHDIELVDANVGLVNLGALRLVFSENEPFALPGDSGSLVVDSRHRAVGVVVGTTADYACAYVMSLAGAKFLDPDLYERFFSEAK